MILGFFQDYQGVPFMNQYFESVVKALFLAKNEENILTVFDPASQFEEEITGQKNILRKLNTSFLITMIGASHPDYQKANDFLHEMKKTSKWEDAARFYLDGVNKIHKEIEDVFKKDPAFAQSLKQCSEWFTKKENSVKTEDWTERIHSIFFPEATGIQKTKKESIDALRKKRTVIVKELNANPITAPDRQILFTSNVLLTIPSASTPIDELSFSDALKKELKEIAEEPQLYWYDHPVQIGVEPGKNEILYGLQGLDQAFDFECRRGNVSGEAKLTCLLSVTVTHQGLQKIAGQYLKEELIRTGGLKHIDVYVFTEADTQQLINKIFIPASRQYLGKENGNELLDVFGVDGEYGRHYSFLKAIAPFWQTLICSEVRATFKIDLDQVFPQNELVEESGASAFEHFMTPLWGAKGTDCNGHPIELGLIAGALVNEQDIGNTLFTPDVKFPERDLTPDEHIFFSPLPQALSTEAEMMTRYNIETLDGKKACLQRFHVTGGTNGILIDPLRRYRPFTPSFIGRAEDQAYILSTLSDSHVHLGYVHKDGLIMRHDKDAFAKEAIESASIGKSIGDYIRILYFSAYANILVEDVMEIKDKLDPFTGCFISKIPLTVVHLRFALKAASFFDSQKEKYGFEFITNGIQRLHSAIQFIQGENSKLKQQYKKERNGWDLYYDIISALEEALRKEDPIALDLRKKATELIHQCRY
jgi:hypothetical protein